MSLRVIKMEDEINDETLEYKLGFLHGCMAPEGFKVADGYLEKLELAVKDPAVQEKIRNSRKLYEELRKISEQHKYSDNEYQDKFRQLRDLLLD